MLDEIMYNQVYFTCVYTCIDIYMYIYICVCVRTCIRLGKMVCSCVNDDQNIDVDDQKLNSGRPQNWTFF